MRRWLLVGILAGCSPSPLAEPVAPTHAPAEPAPVTASSVRARPPADAAVDPAADAAIASARVIDAPMAWSDERARLTLAYRRRHSDAAAVDLVIAPAMIVLHYTGGGSAAGTRAYFDHVRIEAGRKALARAGAVNVSAHFVIDRDGTIYQLQPVTRFARHCIGLNHLAIGIENVGDERRWPLTDAQVAANAALVRDLVRTHGITRLVGHHEVMSMRDDPAYRELDPTYGNRKADPGPAFMARVRAAVADLDLDGG